MNKFQLKGLLVLSLSLILLISSIFFLVLQETEIKEVPCYDRQGNKILGVMCESEEWVEPYVPFMWLCPILGLGGLLIGLTMIAAGESYDE